MEDNDKDIKIDEREGVKNGSDKMAKKYIRVKSHIRKIKGKKIRVKAYLRKKRKV